MVPDATLAVTGSQPPLLFIPSRRVHPSPCRASTSTHPAPAPARQLSRDLLDSARGCGTPSATRSDPNRRAPALAPARPPFSPACGGGRRGGLCPCCGLRICYRFASSLLLAVRSKCDRPAAGAVAAAVAIAVTAAPQRSGGGPTAAEHAVRPRTPAAAEHAARPRTPAAAEHAARPRTPARARSVTRRHSLSSPATARSPLRCLPPRASTPRVSEARHAPPAYTFHVGSTAFARKELEEAGWRPHEPSSLTAPSFSRFCRFVKSVPATTALVRPFPYSTCLSHVCDKRLLCDAVRRRQQNPSHEAPWPETVTSVEEWMRAVGTRLRGPAVLDDLWYVKTGGGWMGRGVHVFDTVQGLMGHVADMRAAAPDSGTGRGMVIQRAVSNLHLIENRKVVMRSHMLICGPSLRAYVHTDGVVIQHKGDYDGRSTDRQVQVLHDVAYHDGFLNRREECLYDVYQPQLKKICRELFEILKPSLRASQELAQPKRCGLYALLGIDCLIDADHKVWCLEVNESPALRFTEPGAKEVCDATIRDFLSLHVFPVVTGATPEAGGWELLPTSTSVSRPLPSKLVREPSVRKVRTETAKPARQHRERA